MKFVLLQSLLQDAFFFLNSKNLKIKWGQVTLSKSGLSTPSTHGPLGVKVEEPIMNQISNTASVNLKKFMFSIFLT
jgi:hypothetical protein